MKRRACPMYLDRKYVRRRAIALLVLLGVAYSKERGDYPF